MHLLILGFGYSASAFAREIRPECASITVTARSAEKVDRLRAESWDALPFDGLTSAPALNAAVHRATHVLVSAPPSEVGDPVLRALGPRLLEAPVLKRVLYLSTVGVYGDHEGAWVDEESPLRPVSQRSLQRVAAENSWQVFAASRNIDLGIFRLSGIYGPGRSAIDNLRAGTARRIIKPGQVFNRIHVADIAGALSAAIRCNGPLGVFNLTDHEPAPPQDIVEFAARLLNVPVPPDIPFDEAKLSEMGRSFYGENKRVTNGLIRSALNYTFRCPTYREGLRACL
ncbi:MAG: SDR family oxidoreductase [Rhizobiales bacterium]|nr:SDR family oxidoreductase [Hyphomicrobiales bacterium]